MGQSHYWFASSQNGINYYPLPYSYQTTWLIISTISAFFKLLVKRPLAVLPVFSTIKKDYQKNKSIKGGRNWLLDFIRLATCKQIQPDLIHNQWSPALIKLAPLFCHYPIVQSLHGRLEDIEPYSNLKAANTYLKFFPLVSGFQSASRKLLENAKLFGAKSANTYVSYSLVSEEWLTSRHKENKIQDKKVSILSIGKFAWRKGYLHALDAMKLLKQKGLSFEYHIVGWDDPTEVKFHVADQDLENQVKLSYNLSHKAIFEALKEADVLLIASVEEGFATVATEAMAVGVPLITTDCGGMGELIKHQVNGWLIPSRDPKAMAEAIEDFRATSSKELDCITNNARDLVEERLTWEHQIKNFEKLYKLSIA
jgi:colanic acid/amylovoran biosynthesis glycosyltransferase